MVGDEYVVHREDIIQNKSTIKTLYRFVFVVGRPSKKATFVLIMLTD